MKRQWNEVQLWERLAKAYAAASERNSAQAGTKHSYATGICIQLGDLNLAEQISDETRHTAQNRLEEYFSGRHERHQFGGHWFSGYNDGGKQVVDLFGGLYVPTSPREQSFRRAMACTILAEIAREELR